MRITLRHSIPSPRRAFTLLELAVVIVIIGIVAAIAVPRLSRGAEGAQQSSLVESLQVLNRAAEHYAAEHRGQYPDAANAALQLTEHTDESGAWSITRTPPYIYGPYLRRVPAIPTGPQKGSTGIAQVPGPGVAWLYEPLTGEFSPNLDP